MLGIAIVANLFLTYLVRVMYHEPTFENFCPQKQVNEAIETQEACLNVGGQWNENVSTKFAPQPALSQPAGYCDINFTCQKQFEDVNRVYNRNVFVVFDIAGILFLAGSVFLTGMEAVSLALSFGGVLALVIGATRYWSDMDDILRVVVLGLALAGLVWVAYKKFRQ